MDIVSTKILHLIYYQAFYVSERYQIFYGGRIFKNYSTLQKSNFLFNFSNS